MTLISGGDGEWTVREQIIGDPLMSGLMLWFRPEGDGFVLALIGDSLEYGNREFAFNARGEWTGVGTAVDGPDSDTLAALD